LTILKPRFHPKYVNIKVVSSERGEGAGEILLRFGYSLCRRVLRDPKDRLFAVGPLIFHGNQQVAINKYCTVGGLEIETLLKRLSNLGKKHLFFIFRIHLMTSKRVQKKAFFLLRHCLLQPRVYVFQQHLQKVGIFQLGYGRKPLDKICHHVVRGKAMFQLDHLGT
jgi:hypothetical protein